MSWRERDAELPRSYQADLEANTATGRVVIHVGAHHVREQCSMRYASLYCLASDTPSRLAPRMPQAISDLGQRVRMRVNRAE